MVKKSFIVYDFLFNSNKTGFCELYKKNYTLSFMISFFTSKERLYWGCTSVLERNITKQNYVVLVQTNHWNNYCF